MSKKSGAILLAVMMLIGALFTAPVSAETEGPSLDMETWEQEEGKTYQEPIGFDVKLGEQATVEPVDEPLYGNTSKKMKIVHTQNTKTTVTVHVTLDGASGVNAEYSMYFLLKELSEGEGVRFSVSARFRDYSTYYFSDATYEKWRKMMCASIGNALSMDMTVTFSGKGILYLDNAEAKKTIGVMNGDFEGVIGDGMLFGTTKSDSNVTYDDVEWRIGGMIDTMPLWPSTLINVKPGAAEPAGEASYKEYFVETNDNNYILLVNPPSQTTYFRYYGRSNAAGLEDGKSYRLSLRHKGTNNHGIGVTKSLSIASLPSKTNYSINYAGPSADWKEKHFDFVAGFGNDVKQLNFGLSGWRQEASYTEATKVYIDDVRVTEIKDKASLLKAETGEAIERLPRKEKVTLLFEKPLLDTAIDTYESLDEDGKETARKITLIAALYEKNGTTKKIKDIQFVEKSGKTVVGNAFGGRDPKHPTEIGFLPAQASFDFEIPETGDYEIRLMAWNSIGDMTPAVVKTYTFETTPLQN